MIRLIAIFLRLLFAFAVVKRKPAKIRKPQVSRQKPAARPHPRAKGKRAPASSAKKSAPPVEPTEPPRPPPPPPIQPPALFSPLPGASTESLTPSFRWFYVGGANLYQLVWSVEPNFHHPHILLTNQTAATLPAEQALQPATNYVWRVRGGNESGWGPWSLARQFRTPEE